MSRVGLAVCATMTLLALGGCERGTPEKGRTSIEVPEGDYQPRLLAMPDAQRNAVFFRAVHDAGRDCQRVVSSAFQGPLLQGRPTWTARCEDGGGWVIIIGKAGVAEVVNLVEAERAGLIKPGSK